LRWFYHADEAARLRARYTLSAVPCANPDGWAAGAGPANGSGGDPSRGYPPEGNAYGSPTDPEAAYLWRWIGMHAPDLVVEVRAGESAAWRIVESDDAQLNRLAAALPSAERVDASEELFCQLPLVAPSNVGTIPAVLVQVGGSASGEPLETLFEAIAKSAFRGPSPARRELQRRLDRSPLEVAEQLSKIYGHELDQVVYIPALALIGRLRLGELTKDPGPLADVERIVAPYRTGKKPALPSEPSGSDLSGHLVFGELARRTGEKAYLDLARAAADFGFDADGKPMNAMPFHLEMSDSVFMGGPILAQVGRLTGERRYFDLCARHLRFMRDVDLRPDGLYRHSPLDEAAWGRGNGFPALGVAMCLADFPDDHPDRPELVEQFRAHLAVLARHQDPTGTWHQVIDVPASYRELTATCMITFAMVRGIRLGVLDRAAYEPIVERAWYAIRTRVAPDGTLVDVCTGTGKQMSLRDYFDRTAILGPDARGGAMALLVATEMAEWEAEGR
jgi:rhamnogalacturonyl hydrolase YesR